MLIHLYSASTNPDKGKQPIKNGNRDRPLPPLPNGHARGSAADRQLRDVQEFELEALMSDDEDPESAKLGARNH
jgi:hypothetical protein